MKNAFAFCVQVVENSEYYCAFCIQVLENEKYNIWNLEVVLERGFYSLILKKKICSSLYNVQTPYIELLASMFWFQLCYQISM